MTNKTGKKLLTAMLVFAITAMLSAGVVFAAETENGNPPSPDVIFEILPGSDIVADGTEPVEQPQATSYSTVSHPETAEKSDLPVYVILFLMAVTAVLIYSQNVIIEKRRAASDRYRDELDDFRKRCASARRAR